MRHRAITRTHVVSEHELGSSRVRVHWAADIRRGGASRDRTGDLLLAKQALSQLSYGPFVHLAEIVETISADITLSAASKKRGFCWLRPGGSGRSCTSDLTLIRGAL